MSAITMIEHYEVPSGGVATILLDSIPATYTHLILMTNLRCDRATGTFDLYKVTMNGSNTLNSGITMENSSSESRVEIGIEQLSTSTASTFNNGMHFISNYAGSIDKSFAGESVATNSSGSQTNLQTSGTWTSASAISSLTLDPGVGDFVQYSTVTLYALTGDSDGVTSVS